MKNFVIVSFGLMISMTSFAQANISVEGKTAKQLSNALEKSGAYYDCAAGTCGTEASDIQCWLRGNSIGKRHYDCNLAVQDETGNSKKVSTIGKVAKSLLDALDAAGAELNCGMGSCVIEAKEIQIMIHGNSVGHRKYEATVTP
ncbi:MAG: hypothetical protein ACXVCP_04550 [Bdellovibrio sp.]